MELKPNGADVWMAKLSAGDEELATAAASLSSDERDRARCMRLEGPQRAFILRRGILRQLLGRYVGCAPHEVRLSAGPKGKLRVEHGLGFSVSHSRGIALYAFSMNRRVGIDVEYMAAELVVIPNEVLPPEQVAMIAAAPVDRRVRTFFECWTETEAYLKGVGIGIAAAAANREELQVMRPHWCVRQISVAPGFAAALATEGQPCDIQYYPWAGKGSAACTLSRSLGRN